MLLSTTQARGHSSGISFCRGDVTRTNLSDPYGTGVSLKLKLDENFDVRLVPELLKEGFDEATVIAEGLAGSTDEAI